MDALRGSTWTGIWALALTTVTAGCGDDGSGDDGAEPTSTTMLSDTTVTPASDSGDDPTTSPTPATDSSGDGTPGDSGTETGEDTDDPTTGGGAMCGNGMTDPGEACDDGNGTDADGCNQDCTVSGSVLWSHNQSSAVGQNDRGFAVAVDDDGQAYVGGDFHNATNLDFWVRQYTDEDALGWTYQSSAGIGNDAARGALVDGDTLYVAGFRNITGQGNNVWLRSFGLDGSPGLDISYNAPSNSNDVALDLALTPTGNLIVAGYETNNISMTGRNGWVREYTPAGSAGWTATYNGPSNSTDQVNAVAVDSMGNVAVTGYQTVGSQQDIWVRVYDPAGAPVWTTTYEGVEGLNDQGTGIAFDAADNVVVVGWEGATAIPWRLFFRKYDPMGMELWTQTWDGETAEGMNAQDVAIDGADDIVVVGQQRVGEFGEMVVRKYDTNGTPRWTTGIDGAADASDVARSVAIGPVNRIWISGDIDLGVDGSDVYVARIAP
ncbi:MAG: hypothetical protein AAF799_24115 [Myxococcota bacterium]